MKYIYILLLSGLIVGSLSAQEETEEVLPIETFRSYRLVNGQTAETVWRNNMLLTFSHRFHGPISGGIKQFFGFDDYADIRFGFAYGLTDRLSVEVGRTRTGKHYDGSVKYKFLQQTPERMPFSATLLLASAVMTDDFPENQKAALAFEHRISYIGQLFVARKFSERIGMQLTAAHMHQNLAQKAEETNNTWILGGGGRLQITRVFHVSAEYLQPVNNLKRGDKVIKPVIGIGFDFLTPRHAFQLTLGNNKFLLEQHFLSQTTQNLFYHRGILLGFHVTRNFALK